MISDYSELQQYIGVKYVTEDVITATQVHRLNLTLNRKCLFPKEGDTVPWGWHFIFFPRLIQTENLSEDGLSAEFEGCPDSPLPKRMFVGNNLKFFDQLRIGDHASKEIYIQSVTPKEGKSGKLVFVTFAININGPRGRILEDEHMMVFKDDEPNNTQLSSIKSAQHTSEGTWKRTLTLNEATLFRYSAVTFNPHRIHYDQPYAVKTENYRALVVQGGLTSILLLELLDQNWPKNSKKMSGYKMRAKAPLFANEPITLWGKPSQDEKNCQLWAVDKSNNLAMEIEVFFDLK